MPGMGRTATALFMAEARRAGYADEAIEEACGLRHRGARLAADDLAAKVRAMIPPGERAQADDVRAALANSRSEPNRDAAKTTAKLMRSILAGLPAYRPVLSASPAPPYELFPAMCRLADAERAERYLTDVDTAPWDGHYAGAFTTSPNGQRVVGFGEDRRAVTRDEVGYIRRRTIKATVAVIAVALASKRVDLDKLRPNAERPDERDAELRAALEGEPEYSLLIELKDRLGEKREEDQYGLYRLRFTVAIRDGRLHRRNRAELVKVERADVHRGAEIRWRTARKSPETGKLLDWLADAIIDPDEGGDTNGGPSLDDR